MPDKSHRSRGKNSAQAKKRGGRPSRPPTLARQTAGVQTQESVSSPKAAVAPASVPTPVEKPATISYPYIAAELSTIGILAGIMLIVLVVLALVLP